jgi:hypothetical protein
MFTGLSNSISLGQFGQGIRDLTQGIKSNDAGNAANAMAQILAGIQTAVAPTGDFTGIANLGAAVITTTKIVRDFNDPNKVVDPLDFVAVAGNLASLAIALGKNHPVLRGVNVILGVAQVVLGSAFSGDASGATKPTDISETANTLFAAARNFILRLDPLVLDLDGDGLELISANGSVLFDHNADGIKTGTGWAQADDGFLVRDINGNGLIDTGRELFGVDTIKRNNTLATDGFGALKELDTNNDGFITSADTAYGQPKVWKDTKQDCISQASEIRTLSGLGTSSLNVAGKVSDVNLGNGTSRPLSGSCIRTNGSTEPSGVAEVSGSLLLAGTNFYQDFMQDTNFTVAA